eukprot:scaffold50391_cov37-Cyclotella_meneghiniana.AAC.1
MLSFLSRKSGNSSKIEKVLLKNKSREQSLGAATEQEIRKELLKAEAEIRLKHAPMRREEELASVEDALESIIQILEFRAGACSCPDSFVGKGSSQDPVCIETESGSLEDPICIDDKSPDKVTAPAKKKAKKAKSDTTIAGRRRPELTWYDRSIGVYLYLHPSIYGLLPTDDMRYNSVGVAVGADGDTVRKWVSLKDKGSEHHVSIWYSIVKDMKWSDVKRKFPKEWTAQFDIADDGNVLEQLTPFRDVAAKSQSIIVTKASEGRMANPKARSVESSKNKNVKNVNLTYGKNHRATKRIERKDRGQARAYLAQSQAVEEMVQNRWNEGDPTTRMEVYDMLRCREDCAEGTDFYNSYLAARKGSQLAMFLSRILKRIHFSHRKNSIGQKIPENWRAMAVENVEEVRKVFIEAGVDVVVNADQTFIKFYPEVEYVLAPSGAKRVGGKMNADDKAGFTVMVTAELNASKLLPPFIVYNGTKKKDAQDLERTLWWKYRNWSDAPGRTAKVTFQKKHWFDEDITIEYLEFLLEYYPREIIGLVWDACKAHSTPLVLAFIDQHPRLVVVGIYGGLTSIIQVCDLIANKDLKQAIRKGYYKWRTNFIANKKAEIEREGGSPNNARIKFKMPIDEMTVIVEDGVKEFNIQQHSVDSVRKMFRKVDQDPWNDCKAEFEAHLNSLTENSMYKTLDNNNRAADLDES